MRRLVRHTIVLGFNAVVQIWLTLVAVIRMALLPTIYSQFFADAPGNCHKTRAIVTFV